MGLTTHRFRWDDNDAAHARDSRRPIPPTRQPVSGALALVSGISFVLLAEVRQAVSLHMPSTVFRRGAGSAEPKHQTPIKRHRTWRAGRTGDGNLVRYSSGITLSLVFLQILNHLQSLCWYCVVSIILKRPAFPARGEYASEGAKEIHALGSINSLFSQTI